MGIDPGGDLREGIVMPVAQHNVVAGFTDRDKVEEAVVRLEEAGVPRSEIRIQTSADRALVGKAEMREEIDRAWGGPAFSIATEHQTKGAATWTPIGTIIGAAVGALVGLVFFDGAAGMIASVVGLALAGATAGVLIGGFVGPKAVDADHAEAQEQRVVVAVHSEVQEHVEKAQHLLGEVGAERVERFDREGNPVPELHGRSGREVRPSQTGRRLETRG